MLNIFIKDDWSIEAAIKVKSNSELSKIMSILSSTTAALNTDYSKAEGIPTLYLCNCGSSKLQCVKALKCNLKLSLKEAKNLADKTSCDHYDGEIVELLKCNDIEYLRKLKENIEASGASCEIM